ncbi:MAG: hypothetical protein ACJA2S_005753 [Cyclobacteriaceae bacterium]|jgi:hypothetical protein
MNKLFAFLILVVMSSSSMAQDMVLQGKVFDFVAKEGLSGVLIKIVGRDNSSLTTEDGTYEIKLKDGFEYLIFSLFRYQPQTIYVDGQTEIDVELYEHFGRNEKIMIGFGQQIRAELTSSISKIKAEEVTSAPLVSLEQGSQAWLQS